MAPPPEMGDFDGDPDGYGAYDPSIDHAFDSEDGF
jgi:hypothetical protein